MKQYPWIQKFQVTQERVDRVVMQIVPRGDQAEQEINVLKHAVAAKMSPGVEVVAEKLFFNPRTGRGIIPYGCPKTPVL